LRPITSGQAVVNMPPVVGRDVGGIDAQRFDDLDRVEHFLDPRPARNVQQAVAAGVHVRGGDVALARRNGA
jgi:hypothetical protein